MAKVVVLGLPGEEGLWIADFEAGSINRLDVSDNSSLSAANELRKDGSSFVQGINLALPMETASAAFSGYMDG
jgi:ABC-type phosphate transport system substrate-binding protein